MARERSFDLFSIFAKEPRIFQKILQFFVRFYIYNEKSFGFIFYISPLTNKKIWKKNLWRCGSSRTTGSILGRLSAPPAKRFLPPLFSCFSNRQSSPALWRGVCCSGFSVQGWDHAAPGTLLPGAPAHLRRCLPSSPLPPPPGQPPPIWQPQLPPLQQQEMMGSNFEDGSILKMGRNFENWVKFSKIVQNFENG